MKVTVYEAGTTVVLACGLVVEGRPQPDAAYAKTAQELGYGDDILAMCQDHDALHVAMCQWLNVESFALFRATGQPITAREAELADAEEAAVLAIQKFKRLTSR